MLLIEFVIPKFKPLAVNHLQDEVNNDNNSFLAIQYFFSNNTGDCFGK